MSEFIHAAALQHRAKGRIKRGRTLAAYRFSAHQAAALERKGYVQRAQKTLQTAADQVRRDLINRHPPSYVWKKAHVIKRILDRVAQQEADEYSDRNER